MAEGVSVLSTRMRENLFNGDNGMDSIETESQGSREDIMERDPGFVEDRFRVDRKKLEQMLQLVPSNDDADEGAEEFFQRVMEETNTEITWPSKLKIGAKSKKDPHIKVIGYPENVSAAKSRIMTVLDTKSNRVTLKMDVSHTEHSHVIGKGGNNIKRVMTDTGCHIHFPDSNRGNSVQEKSNQVSIAGQPEGVEIARAQIRELLPLVFMFEMPVTSPVTPVPDVTSAFIQQLQQANNITINFKQRPRTYATTVIIRGSVYSAKGVKHVTARLMEQLTGSVSLPVSMQLEIAPQHHMFIIGRAGVNIKHIMQQTGSNILFPDPNTASPQRKGTVFINGNIESVFLARQHLIGCLPLVLMFDVKETIELDQARISHLMEALDVYISVKPKPKQPSKSVIVKSIERNSANMYLTREILLGLRSDHLKPPVPLALSGVGYIHPSLMGLNSTSFLANVATNTTSFLSSTQPNSCTYQPSGQPNQPNGQSHKTSGPPCTASPVLGHSRWLQQSKTTGVYSPLMVVTPATCVSSLDLMSPTSVVSNGFHHDFSNSTFIRVPTPLDHGHGSNTSDSTSPVQSPSNSPTPVGLCNTAADLANLQTRGALGDTTALLSGPIHHHHHHHHQQQHQAMLHHHHSMDLLGLSSHSHAHLMNGDKTNETGECLPSDKLAPGIERKNSLYASPQFTVDYEQKKLLAMKAMQKKPEGESRIPTDIWAGMGFSKSMPESAIRDKLGQMGISARVTDNSINSGYEPNRPEIDLSIDKDLWNDERGLSNRPLNKAPGEYPSPRKKFQYGLSHSNHVDSASLPSTKTMWSTKADLAELFSALSLGKYTDLFQQQEIDLSTFLTLSDHDLRELGISTFGARRKMLLAIADLNKRRTLLPASISRTSSMGHVSSPRPTSPGGGAISLPSGGNSASELFPSPNPAPSLMSARSGPDLGSLSGHW
ncbi:unnamed protein product [Lymnaea stagnalis]|uniref:SAM domain-containing protein n=1 Tax=Lymnaea stagnalis TaxID=6523 RepID=A0AAV2HTI4_LYMST